MELLFASFNEIFLVYQVLLTFRFIREALTNPPLLQNILRL
jgi:hypothetical protein